MLKCECGQSGKRPAFEEAQAWNWRVTAQGADEVIKRYFFPLGVMRKGSSAISHNYGGLGNTSRKSSP